ncbi:bifunctional sugar phosphate isomerase/epimerase/4-hydroxyphenylpyruvate dioxygenase family protein [Chelativorans sp. YIM 93263]|uniref:bifunctional sugar phosphate isomerase/epimerase/4-hydroxyphenylpyruvate dioxygenase family protein n=1 Tax=Chelativorans sp. YIM 93263 TaxID=2906648 RepID=UPI0023781AC7|nr:sugar phosphate isomerase/epimerase and 4-hydroxyphenylpyruvate domain-containing protein [Chelativorans sp. YIM 93263]
MKTGIATVSISGNLEEKIETIAAAGFSGIEIFEQDFIADVRSPRVIGERIREAGLEVMLFQPFRDFEGLPGALRAKAFDRAERKFDVMQELGCDLMLVCSSVHSEALGGIDRAAADFAALGERAASRGLRVGYEALAWGRHINDHRDAWEIVRRADHDAIGLILDSFHTLGRGIDTESIRRIPGERIFFVQLADAPAIEMDLLYWSRHFRNMPGEGDLAVTDFMRAVMATGYAGPVSLEIFNDQFRGGSPDTIAQDGYRSLIALMDEVRRVEPEAAPEIRPLPKPIPVRDTAFVEFAAQGEELAALESLLESLGFRQVGRHVSKHVTLWQQGAIRIVLNAETTGHAGTAWNARGPTVCDIGLSVGSAADTVTRATALGAKTFSQPLGPGELPIPAIRGLGGSVMHFIDDGALSQVWDVEFLSEDHAGQDAGLTRIDHIAQTMSYDEMLSWSLFYTTLFDMERAPMVDVVDPDGLVRSRAIATPAGDFRITLNGAETRRTLAGSFLAEGSGGTVQHVALATDDIFSTAKVLREKGFPVLQLSPNYFDDLAARFEIDPSMLERMREANILYDADSNGEYFQLYSQPFARQMFMEIVERRGGYSGYGAPNAPFRIAAQKRHQKQKG